MSKFVYYALLIVLLTGIIRMLIRMLIGPIRSGIPGTVPAFVVQVFIWPIRIIGWLVDFLVNHFRILLQAWHTHRRRHRRRSLLAKAAQDASLRAPRPRRVEWTRTVRVLDSDRRPGPSPDDYPKDKFDELWQEHLRRHRREDRNSWDEDQDSW
jgi:hypothetical protein